MPARIPGRRPLHQQVSDPAQGRQTGVDVSGLKEVPHQLPALEVEHPPAGEAGEQVGTEGGVVSCGEQDEPLVIGPVDQRFAGREGGLAPGESKLAGPRADALRPGPGTWRVNAHRRGVGVVLQHGDDLLLDLACRGDHWLFLLLLEDAPVDVEPCFRVFSHLLLDSAQEVLCGTSPDGLLTALADLPDRCSVPPAVVVVSA